MTSPSGGYNPYQSYGTAPASGSTSVTPGSFDLYLPASLANQPIFVGTNSKPINWDSRDDTFTPSPITVKASDLVKQYAALSATDPTAFASVQSLLYASGSYAAKPTWGVWTSKDSSAFSKALTAYMQVSSAGAPITFSEWLGNAAQVGAASSASGRQSTVTDPASIEQAAQAAAQEALGRGLTPTELSQFVSSFQAKQQAAQTSTATTVTAPDLSSDALAYAQSTAPNEYKAQQSNSYTNALLNMFLPSGSSRPSTTPVPDIPTAPDTQAPPPQSAGGPAR